MTKNINKTIALLLAMGMTVTTGCGAVGGENVPEATTEASSEAVEVATDVTTNMPEASNVASTGASAETPEATLSDCIWTREEQKDITVPLDFSLQEGTHELYIPAYSEEAGMEYRIDGETICRIRGILPSAVKEVVACDFSFDGTIDLIMVDVDDNMQEEVRLYEGFMPEYEEDNFWFSGVDLIDSAKADLDGVYDAEEIRNYLTQGLENGKLSDYGEAYRAVIRYNQLTEYECKYSLIYLNEDEEPDLMSDCCILDVFCFANGTVTQPMVTCGYGVGGCVYYEYAPYKNSIRTFGHGQESYYDTYYAIKDDMLTEMYSQEGFYEADDVNFYNYTDEYLSDAEVKSRVQELGSYQYEEMHGTLTEEEMLAMLP